MVEKRHLIIPHLFRLNIEGRYFRLWSLFLWLYQRKTVVKNNCYSSNYNNCILTFKKTMLRHVIIPKGLIEKLEHPE